MAKKAKISVQQSLLDATLKAIQAGLPAGYTATNKKPVQKEIRKEGSAETTTVWTSWCKDPDGNRHLALLLSNGRVKLISQDALSNYKHHSI